MTSHQANIVNLYLEGLSLREIAGRLNISYKRVHAIILEQAPGILRLPHWVPPHRRWRGGNPRKVMANG